MNTTTATKTNSEDPVESLTDELRKLIGWGARPHRLAHLPALRLLAGVPEGANARHAGGMIRQFLIRSIQGIEEVWFVGTHYTDVVAVRRAYRLLFGLECSLEDAPNRRYRAISLLNVPVSVEQWRRPEGLERDFVRELAQAMVQGSNLVQTPA